MRTEAYAITLPQGHIHARRWTPLRPQHAEPIVLLHDSLGSVEQWRDFPETLGSMLSRSVIAYDRLGFGRSDQRFDLPSLNFIAEEATVFFPAIKAALALQSYVLLGHSVGGGMAINIAARDTDCKAVITEAAQAYVERRTIASIKAAQAMFEDPEQLGRLVKRHGDKARWVLDAWTSTWLSEGFANWSLDDCIGDVLCPVLAIHGDRDEYGSSAFPRYIAEKSGKTSAYLILEDCGHVPHREKPAETINAVKNFLATRLHKLRYLPSLT